MVRYLAPTGLGFNHPVVWLETVRCLGPSRDSVLQSSIESVWVLAAPSVCACTRRWCDSLLSRRLSRTAAVCVYAPCRQHSVLEAPSVCAHATHGGGLTLFRRESRATAVVWCVCAYAVPLVCLCVCVLVAHCVRTLTVVA